MIISPVMVRELRAEARHPMTYWLRMTVGWKDIIARFIGIQLICATVVFFLLRRSLVTRRFASGS